MKTTFLRFTAITVHRALGLSLGLVLALLSATTAQGATYTLGATHCWEGPASGTNSVVLGVNPANGTWSATANAAWLHLSAANQSGTGSTNVVFTFDANTGATRSGTLTIGGQTLTVTQAGSTYVSAPEPVTALVSSGLGGPFGVAVDGAGNVYITDHGAGAIREWVAASNTVATLVSSGLNSPYGVAVDGAGNVYIADTGNNAIKEWVAASNTVVTLVSGLNQPEGVAVDDAGNVYIADTDDLAIKEWIAASHTVVTLVSGLDMPEGVAVDGAGNVYIDLEDNAIKEWVAASGSVTTLVSSGLSYPHSVAVDGAGNVYIADTDNNAIKEWVAASHTVTTLVSSGLSYPFGVAVDGAGNVYFSDYNNEAIKELPRAFVDPTAKWEGPTAGSDVLPVVLPPIENLLAPFAPASDQPWLTITSVTNGVVSYAFTGTTTNRTAHITLLGQSIPITQLSLANYSSLGATNFLEGPGAGSDSVVLAVNPVNGAWTATANASWLHLSAANQSGTGSTNVVFTFDANPGGTRTGTLTIADQTLTVTQAGSTYVRASGPVTALVSSGLNNPFDVAVDGAGNVYIADTGDNAIKEWIAANNSVATLVSSGLQSPYGVAVDGAGNVYIADTGNNAIKEWVAASDTVTTLVSSGLKIPYGVAVDGAGNVYIADSGDNAIKEWVAASNSVATLVSSGLNSPFGVAVDRAGNVYIADTGNNAIKEWTAANHSVATLVSSGLNYPDGVAADGAGNVYVAVAGNNTIKVWSAASNTVTTLVSSGLNTPTGVAVDGAGNVYIADDGNDAIKELPRAFVVPTARSESGGAGSDSLPVVLPPTENLLAPFAPTSDQSWLNITGVNNGVVSFSFLADGTTTNRTAHITLLGQAITINQQAPTYFSYWLGTTNLLEGPASGVDSVVLGVIPVGMPWSATANDTWLHLSAANQSGTGSTNVVFTFDANTGATRSGTLTIGGQTLTVTQAGSTYVRAPGPVIALVSSGLSHPSAVAVGGAGNVYIADTFNGAIREWIAASNTVVTLVSSGLSYPNGVAVDGAGNVYIADTGDNAIKEWIAASNTVTTLASWGLSGPSGVAVDGAGNVYVADTGNNAIKEWIAASGSVTTLVSSGLNGPMGVAVDAAGNVYIADNGDHAIKEWIAANGSVTNLVSSGLDSPVGVAVDGAGNVYIADNGNSEVKERIAASGSVTSLASSGLDSPAGVAVDGAGNVYVVDSVSNVVKELPRAFVVPTARSENAAAGSDSLPVVLPPVENLLAPFAPTSDQSWLTITSVTNGVVSFSFTGTTTNRTAHITLLGQVIAINQQGPTYTLGTTNLLEGPGAGSDSVVLAVNTPNGPWTAMANDTWLHLSAANQSGAGSANVVFSYDANPGGTRTGTLTIAGQALTITQAGSTYVRAPGPVTALVSSNLSYPYDVAVDGAGNVYIADMGHSVIKEWVAASNTVTTLVSRGLNQPFSVAVDGAGNVYIADTKNNAIDEWVAASHTERTLVSSGLYWPEGVAVDGAGNVYIADTGNSAIKEWIAASNTVSTVVSNGLSSPTGVAVDRAGNVYIADYGSSAIDEWIAASDTVTTLISSGLSGPFNVAVDGAGNVYAGCGDNTVKEWVAASNNVVTLVPSGLNWPTGVTVDGAGNVYIADSENNVVKELPRAFVDPTARYEGNAAGTDSLPVVLPPTENLRVPFAPTSDQPWLNITGANNGVVGFSFTGTTTNRTAHITLLGQAIAIYQSGLLAPPTLVSPVVLANGSFQFAFSNTVPGASFTVWSATNLALPLADWTAVATSTNCAAGWLQFTIPLNPNAPQCFYDLRSP